MMKILSIMGEIRKILLTLIPAVLSLGLLRQTAVANITSSEEYGPILLPVKEIMPLSIIKGLPGQGRIEDIGFSPDGKLIAMSGGNSVLLWNLATDEVKKIN